MPGPSFIIGHDKGGLVAIAQIETVGATGAHGGAQGPRHHQDVEQLKGKKIANQTGSSIGNIFVDQVGPANGLKKGDFQEVRMDVNNMIAAMAAKTVDAMVNIEPYNAIAEAEGLGTMIMDLSKYDKVPVFMAATPDFVEKNPDAIVAYLKAWLEVAARLQGQPEEGVGRDLFVLHLQGLHHEAGDLRQGDGPRRRRSGLPDRPRALHDAAMPRCCCKEKKISAIPDWKKALRHRLHGEGARRLLTAE